MLRFVATWRVGAKLLLCTCLLTLCAPLVAHAASSATTINAIVCDPNQGATLHIDSPQSDSVVDNPSVTVSGTLDHVSQIDVYLNGQFDHTQSVAISDTTFSTTVTLPEGTDTIRLLGYDICHVHDAEDSVVVTYQPATTPSGGGQTTTTTPSGGNGGGTVGNPSTVGPGNGSSSGSGPVTDFTRAIKSLVQSLDLQSLFGSWAALPLSFVTIGIALLLYLFLRGTLANIMVLIVAIIAAVVLLLAAILL